MLRFNPKEQHKDELSLRFLALPRLHLQGKVTRARKKALPKVTLELSVRQLNIDVTTDVLNQLLIVQNTFIKVSGCGFLIIIKLVGGCVIFCRS